MLAKPVAPQLVTLRCPSFPAHIQVSIPHTQGRCLRMGDSLPLSTPKEGSIFCAPLLLPPLCCPPFPAPAGNGGAVQWEVGVLPGPHADPGVFCGFRSWSLVEGNVFCAC